VPYSGSGSPYRGFEKSESPTHTESKPIASARTATSAVRRNVIGRCAGGTEKS
jgi:hypothetical protein